MRRLLSFVSLVLLLLGLELSTQTISLTISRMWSGITALIAGVEFYVPALRFVAGMVFVLGGLLILILLVWANGAKAAVGSVGTACPNCGSRTRRVKRKRWQRLLSALMGHRVSRRKCETCGWLGLALTD